MFPHLIPANRGLFARTRNHCWAWSDWSALTAAVEGGSLKTVCLLLENKANANEQAEVGRKVKSS